ncbi:Hypothetical Protein FCC1311_030572 [Hondaea fermentalgiana]|uniref:Uncharacterized protein n=1 Tax=Hondaea fermentalgiana TaxID=2315210 RepID=A0A2R5G8G4_9STRA|nr:Hypothetical Protein FCC1311_030572 [Hondaea fermentalgiana]|eukprot:GBG26835.1 Hypothetical Protein FCC1311_030572 [Hondaea fermentalgiana]
MAASVVRQRGKNCGESGGGETNTDGQPVPVAGHGPPPKLSLPRFLLVVLTVSAMDVSVLTWYAEERLEAAEAPQSIDEALALLGVDVPERDVTDQASLALTVSRLLFAFAATILTVHIYATNNYPLVRSNYGNIVHIRRFKRFTTFTVWSWTLLTAYFLLAATHSLGVAPAFMSGRSRWLPVLFEVCFSAALMVTLVVHFVLIPMARRKDPYRLSRLLNWRALTMHYGNLAMMLVEATLSGLPMKREHWIFMVVYANMYVVFALIWHYATGIFYYFFMDYTRFLWAPLAYVGLVGIMGVVWLACVYFVEALDVYVRPMLLLSLEASAKS